MSSDPVTSFAQELSMDQREAACIARGNFDLSAHVAKRRAIVADCSEQHVAGRVDVRFRITPNIF